MREGIKNPNWKGGIAKNPLYFKSYNHKYYLEHKEKWHNDRFKEQQRKYRHTKKHLEYMRKWQQGHRCGLTIILLQRIYEDNIKRYGTLTCYLCIQPIQFGDDSIDHIIPQSKGGISEYNNLAIAHIKCNSAKCNKMEV